MGLTAPWTGLNPQFILSLSLSQIVPDCNWCNGVLTIKHLLVECPNLTRFRDKWGIPDSMARILGENVDLNNLTHFLKEIGIYHKI